LPLAVKAEQMRGDNRHRRVWRETKWHGQIIAWILMKAEHRGMGADEECDLVEADFARQTPAWASTMSTGNPANLSEPAQLQALVLSESGKSFAIQSIIGSIAAISEAV
jgi:hypothetical protein